LVSSDPRCVGRVCCRGSSFVSVGDSNGLGLRDIVTGEKILKPRCTDSRQNLGMPHGVICLRQLLADRYGEDGGDGGG
jgi:hypothetical protein